MHGASRIAGRIILLAIVIMIMLYVIHQPARAGQSVNAIGVWLTHAGDSLGTFLDSIVH
jgi:hypothetical protein